jgi:methionyl-tRNA formyltransferase
MLTICYCADGPVGLSILQHAEGMKKRHGAVKAIVGMRGADAIANFAADHAIPFILWDDDDLAGTAGKIGNVGADVLLLAWWPQIIGDVFLNLGQRATLNLHPSLLPHCRGKDPNFWAIVEGRPFGVSIHHVERQIDAGDVAFSRVIPYSWTDTGETLYRRAQHEVIALFRDVYPLMVAGNIPKHPQAISEGSFHFRSELDSASVIDLDKLYTARNLLNLIRARTFPPHRGCRFIDGGKTFEVRLSVTELQKEE